MKQVLRICNSMEAQGAGWSSALAANLILFSPELAIGQCVLPSVEPAQHNLIRNISFFTYIKMPIFLKLVLFNPLYLEFIYTRSKCRKILFLQAMGTLINSKKCREELLYCQSNFTDKIYSGN